MSDETKIVLIEITDDNRADLVKVALSMYLGETCPYCLIEFQTLEQLSEAVWNGYTDYGRIAHGSCFHLAHPEAEG
jgi:hypothetical protein